MSVVTVELPNSLHKALEDLAVKEGVSLSHFLTLAAAEKMSALMTADYLKQEAARGTQEGFERFLRAVPDVEPDNPLDRIKEL